LLSLLSFHLLLFVAIICCYCYCFVVVVIIVVVVVVVGGVVGVVIIIIIIIIVINNLLLKHANPFLRTIAKLNGIGADSSDEDADEPLPSWKFTCSCGHFWHNGNLCSHIGAVADTVGAIDLAVLVTKLAGRKLPGRPKKNLGGPLDRVKSTAAEKYASPEWFEKHIETKGAMCVHKHRTAR
jgi:hypothetical protein